MTLRNIDYIAKGASYFKGGYNCAQSVLLAMQEFWNIKNPLEPRAASALGGGVGKKGTLCGALIGGVIAVGLKYGSNVPDSKERQPAEVVTQQFFGRFGEKCGSVYCRDLIRYDLTKPDELAKARGEDVFMKKCVHFVEKALEILIDLEQSSYPADSYQGES